MWFVSWGHCTSHLFSPGSSSICPFLYIMSCCIWGDRSPRSRWFFR
uniref:Uncharacterized protein n=1 Tax=Setaria viridis TaxID=4556 RepID=A0A4U6WRL0_SETVI|nr:hypothetical protein SEVIR_1G334266v2 [Setaria viridis]